MQFVSILTFFFLNKKKLFQDKFISKGFIQKMFWDFLELFTANCYKNKTTIVTAYL